MFQNIWGKTLVDDINVLTIIKLELKEIIVIIVFFTILRLYLSIKEKKFSTNNSCDKNHDNI